MMYYVCKYTPLELLAGFGLPSMRLEPLSDDFETADRLGHANLCGYGKGVLEAAFKDDVRELILVNCCDVIRRVYDILKEKKKMEFLFFLDLPHKHGKADIKYFARELGRLKDACARYTGRTFELQPFWKMWKEEIGELPPAVPYVSLLGAHIHPSAFEKIKTHFSPVPVKDDTCGGNRRLGKAPTELEEHMSASCRYCEVQTDYDPLPAYAEALLLQTPCMRMSDRGGRSSLGKNASGLIYHTMKFCDYFGFEYAERKKYEKIPILKIETNGSAHNAGQLSTRLEAFAESLHLRSDRMGDMKSGRYALGIDSGSTDTKVVIMNEQKEIVGRSIVHTGSGAAASAERALQQALEQHGIAETEISRVVTTGYGREFIDKGDASVTEITCHAKGAYFLDPSVRTVIDIGGQDSKVISLDENGGVRNFVMNDKCAAGTGRFLDMMARTMELSPEEMSRLGELWSNEVSISSMCSVFAESEVVSLVAANTPPPDIIHGLNNAIASRILSLVHRAGGVENYMMTGGVAKNRSLVSVLEKRLEKPIIVSEYAQLCGAIGAALLALGA